MTIHESAIIHDGAEIDPSVQIGPFCVVGPNVKIAAGTELKSHVIIDNHTSIGENNTIHPYAVLGGNPQDLKFSGEPTRLIIGDNNVIREGATMNIGTIKDKKETRVGNHCLFMAYSHVAHDCVVGDHVVLANSVGLAGHVELGDHVIAGGLAGVHQFGSIGRHAFLAGGAMATLDVPPFCIAQGDRAKLVGINVLGLKRAGWDREQIRAVREAFKQLFSAATAHLGALEKVEKSLAKEHPEVDELVKFIRASKRGICAARHALPSTDPYEG